jgi:hypothetical protein
VSRERRENISNIPSQDLQEMWESKVEDIKLDLEKQTSTVEKKDR